MIQSYFDVPSLERFTWFSNGGKIKKVVDYVLTEKFIAIHYMMLCNIRLQIRKWSSANSYWTLDSKYQTRKMADSEKIEKPRNLKALEIQETRKDYASEVINQKLSSMKMNILIWNHKKSSMR